MNPDEQRGYSKGYAAGKRRADRERQAEREMRAADAFERAVFLAVLPALVAKGTWGSTVDGQHKPWTTPKEYVKGAWNFARIARKQGGAA